MVEEFNGRLADALGWWNSSRPRRAGATDAEELFTDILLREGASGVRNFWRALVSGADAQSKIPGIGEKSSKVIDEEIARMHEGAAAPAPAPMDPMRFAGEEPPAEAAHFITTGRLVRDFHTGVSPGLAVHFRAPLVRSQAPMGVEHHATPSFGQVPGWGGQVSLPFPPHITLNNKP
mmetsp:Transcript_21986/g.52820  ORF Transcript_21986/g.52820 Transcript_21986/m.52820 type:complete len:177 (-) Transcript_21986:39-569(-)